MDPQVTAGLVTGIVFLVALLAIACFMAFRRNPNPVPPEVMLIFRGVLAMAAAGFAVVLSGFLQIEGRNALPSIRAACSLSNLSGISSKTCKGRKMLMNKRRFL